MRRTAFADTAFAVTFLLGLAPALAASEREAEPIGRWNRDDGLGGVRISRCGDALCGHIVWLKNAEGPGHVGQRVLYDMRRSAGATWSGSAHNPEDGGTYAGTMTLSGNRLLTRGCALGGAICQTVGLTRAHR